MILLVHSCDSRSWLWEHWWRFFNLSGWDIDVRFIVGEEEFTDQLYKQLNSLDCEYVWHTLDDYWIQFPVDWGYYEKLAKDIKADAIRLQPNVNCNSLPYRFDEAHGLWKQRPTSDYLISTHTSIWRREYFLECLKPGLDPWQWEAYRPECFGDVYFAKKLKFWYIDAALHGVLTPEAKKLMK